jgi:hypothetical protein
MRSSMCVMLVLVAVVGSLWVAGPGCATSDDSGGVCSVRVNCTGGACCGGVPGTWNVTTGTCSCPEAGGDADASDGRDEVSPSDEGGAEDVLHPADDGGGGGAPGSACNCDSDCTGGDATHPAICDGGVCMLLASTTCSADGSTAECPAHLRCWPNGAGTAICWPDCDFYTGCVGDCDGDGSCVPNATTSCDPSCGTACG